MRCFVYLRVSRHTQDVASQRLGVLEYASRHGYTNLEFVEETASRSINWKERKLGDLIFNRAQKGDIILASEITRLGQHSWQMLEVMHEAVSRGVVVAITRMNFVLDGGINASIFATVLGLASQLEREFLKARTIEGVARAAQEGRVGGRPKGSTGRLKLDDRVEKVRELYELGLTTPKLAKHFDVTEKTMRKFIARHF